MKFALASLIASVTAVDYTTWTDGPVFGLNYDAQMLKMNATVPENTWMGLMIRKSEDSKDLKSVDQFQLVGKDANGVIIDTWYKADGTLVKDQKDDLTYGQEAAKDDATKSYKFAIWRPLDTSDAAEDVALLCNGADYELMW